MRRKNFFLLVVLIVILAALAYVYKDKLMTRGAGGYSVVYLTTGEVYVGHLSTFPDLSLKNGYILQLVKDPNDATKSNFQLNPIKDALWAPEVMHLIKDNVVFYGPLMSSSAIAKKLAGVK